MSLDGGGGGGGGRVGGSPARFILIFEEEGRGVGGW